MGRGDFALVEARRRFCLHERPQAIVIDSLSRLPLRSVQHGEI
jgi:hypothetical protein